MREKPLKVDFQALIDSQPGARKRIIAATGVSRVRTYQWVRAPDKHCVTIADILGIQPGVLRPDIFTAPIAKSNAVEDLDGQIAIGEVMLLSLSFDHRIVDGHVGAAFAYDIISYLEEPDRLFLEMT